MKQDIKHIIIKHLKGSKANQIEEFDYQANDSISFGRASGNQLQFDSEQDNAVSREHGTITKGGAPGSFMITDNGSLNGTYVNDQKILGTQPLRPGDKISLGAKGHLSCLILTLPWLTVQLPNSSKSLLWTPQWNMPSERK